MEKRTELYRYEAYNFPDGKPRFIVDDDYAQLIEICCKYSSMISFLVANENVDYLSGFSKYEIKSKRDNVKYNIGYGPTAEKRYYAVCDEVKLLLKNATKDLFMWIYDEYEKINNLEDPTFYRADGSIFMETTSHEGMCDLTPYADEDVSDIVSKEGWEKDPAPWQTNLF